MDLSLIPFGLLTGVGILLALVLGIVIGSRRARRARYILQLELNRCNLDLLESRSEVASLSRAQAQQPRKDRLLAFVMRRLKQLEQQSQHHSKILQREKNRHFVREARFKLAHIEAHESGTRARAVATRALAHLRRLEGSLPQPQTIRCPTPKSYGTGEAVTVSVVDQRNANARQDAAARMSNRDSARLTRLHSSNEGCRFKSDNLQAISGIDDHAEQRLNAAGIHRVEQLASLSSEQLNQLELALGDSRASAPSQEWVGNARELLKQNLPMI